MAEAGVYWKFFEIFLEISLLAIAIRKLASAES